MGARAHSRGGAASARRTSGEDAPAAGDGRASLRHDQGPDGSNTLPDEDPATGRHRDGIARPGLQSHARHEHNGHPAAHGGDEGIVIANLRPSPGAEPPKTARIRARRPSRRKNRQSHQNDCARSTSRGRAAAMLPPGRFYTTKTRCGSRVAEIAVMHNTVQTAMMRSVELPRNGRSDVVVQAPP